MHLSDVKQLRQCDTFVRDPDQHPLVWDPLAPVGSVELTDGTQIKAQMVLFSFKNDPWARVIRDSHIQTDSSGFIKCDMYLNTNDRDVYAAGEVATFLDLESNSRKGCNSWSNA